MGKISISDLTFHAFHGCHPDELKTGGNFKVDIHINADFSRAESSDKVEDAIDYVQLMEITKRKMRLRCNLIETVAKNIANGIFERYPECTRIEVVVRKLAPPVPYELGEVSVNYVVENG